jgi:RNA polymerase sigma-70 factor (ECF subfamily)
MSNLPGLTRLYVASDAARWSVTVERFAAALERSVSGRFRDAAPTRRELSRYLDSLHLEDLGLACACASGDEAAWEEFIVRQRPGLYRAAVAIAGEAGRELADSLYGELFGLEAAGGRRRSRLDYFHGRSSLATWLRAILAQRHVDAIRASRRTVPLEERPRSADVHAAGDGPPDLDRPRLTRLLHRSFASAIRALAPDDRLRLDYYYRDGLTLAEIGRIQGTHEATVSRALARSRRALRVGIERRLRVEHGLSADAIVRCLDYAADAGADPPPTHGARARHPPVQGTGDAPAPERGYDR